MSIEIIQKPTHKCSVCGCVFSFDREDLKKIPFGTSPIGDVAKQYLQCPVCESCEDAFKNDSVIALWARH